MYIFVLGHYAFRKMPTLITCALIASRLTVRLKLYSLERAPSLVSWYGPLTLGAFLQARYHTVLEGKKNCAQNWGRISVLFSVRSPLAFGKMWMSKWNQFQILS